MSLPFTTGVTMLESQRLMNMLVLDEDGINEARTTLQESRPVLPLNKLKLIPKTSYWQPTMLRNCLHTLLLGAQD